jgi:murein DD-endopeptidase MepM/ murein hydrolase activator NlpD
METAIFSFTKRKSREESLKDICDKVAPFLVRLDKEKYKYLSIDLLDFKNYKKYKALERALQILEAPYNVIEACRYEQYQDVETFLMDNDIIQIQPEVKDDPQKELKEILLKQYSRITRSLDFAEHLKQKYTRLKTKAIEYKKIQPEVKALPEIIIIKTTKEKPARYIDKFKLKKDLDEKKKRIEKKKKAQQDLLKIQKEAKKKFVEIKKEERLFKKEQKRLEKLELQNKRKEEREKIREEQKLSEKYKPSIKNLANMGAGLLTMGFSMIAAPTLIYQQDINLVNSKITKNKERCYETKYNFEKEQLEKIIEKMTDKEFVFLKSDLIKIFPIIKDFKPGKYSLENIINKDSIPLYKQDLAQLCYPIIFEIKKDKPLAWPLSKDSKVTCGAGHRTPPIRGASSNHIAYDIAYIIRIMIGEDGEIKKIVSDSLIYAAADGIVEYSKWLNGYGNTIKISHEGGLCSYYGHNEKNYVKEGQKVKKGQAIAEIGETGISTGKHLDFRTGLKNGQQKVSPGRLTSRRTFANEEREKLDEFQKFKNSVTTFLYKG